MQYDSAFTYMQDLVLRRSYRIERRVIFLSNLCTVIEYLLGWISYSYFDFTRNNDKFVCPYDIHVLGKYTTQNE